MYRWIRRALLGPAAGLDDVASVEPLIGIKPMDRFQAGILFPVASEATGLDPADDDIDDDAEVGPDVADSVKSPASARVARPKRRILPPSSAGFSFFLQGSTAEIELIPRAVCYALPKGRTDSGVKQWHRTPLGDADGEARHLWLAEGRICPYPRPPKIAPRAP